MQQPQNRREQRMREVLTLASTDLEFRSRLLAEPHRAIRDAFGIEIPPTFRIRFIERGAEDDALVVLPDVVRGSGELDDDDLDAVAGGNGGLPPGDGFGGLGAPW